jgi:hypothetical protein
MWRTGCSIAADDDLDLYERVKEDTNQARQVPFSVSGVGLDDDDDVQKKRDTHWSRAAERG